MSKHIYGFSIRGKGFFLLFCVYLKSFWAHALSSWSLGSCVLRRNTRINIRRNRWRWPEELLHKHPLCTQYAALSSALFVSKRGGETWIFSVILHAVLTGVKNGFVILIEKTWLLFNVSFYGHHGSNNSCMIFISRLIWGRTRGRTNLYFDAPTKIYSNILAWKLCANTEGDRSYACEYFFPSTGIDAVLTCNGGRKEK